MTCWWGPRALFGVLLNAIFSASLWEISQPQQWFFFALPELLAVCVCWWLFTIVAKGKCWLPDINQLAIFLVLGIFPASLINGFASSGQLVQWNVIFAQNFFQHSGNEVLATILDYVFVGLPLGVFLTPILEKRGWSLTHGAYLTPLLPRERHSKYEKWEAVLIFVILLVSTRLLPIEQYWAIYSPIALWAALRFGMGMATLVSSWILFLVVYFPVIFVIPAVGFTPLHSEQAFIKLALIIPCVSAVVAGRLISDMFSEIRLRKTAEEVLRRQEVHHATLLAAIPDIAFVLAPDGTYLDIYTSNEKMLAAGRSKLLGSTIQKEMPPKVAQGGMEAIERALKNHSIESLEYSLLTDDNREHWFHARIIAFEEENVQKILCLVRDETDQKQAEQSLFENEARLRSITSNIEDTIWIVDLNLKLHYISPSLQKLCGFSLEELQNLPLEKQITPASAVLVKRELADWMGSGENNRLDQNESRTIRLEHYKKDGSIFLVDEIVSLLYDEEGIPHSIMGVGRDVTHQQEQERLYSVILSTALDGFVMFDDQGNILDVNGAYCQLMGYSRQELITKNITALEVIDGIDEIKSHIERIRSEGIERFESRHCKKNGQEIDVEVSINFLPSTEGRLVAFIRDITQRKEAEHELVRVNHALRTISDCNQLLVRAQTEAELLDGICKIIAERKDNYRVWIGFAEEDTEKNVRPVAQYGFPEGFIGSFQVTWNESEFGMGPTGTAIRMGTPQIVQNISENPIMRSWKKVIEAPKQVSLLSLPLKGKNRVFGALNIYTSEPNAFNPREVELLMELASDLAFGIEALRIRSDQKMTEEIVHQTRNLAQALSSVEDLETGLQLCLKTAMQMTGIEIGGIYLFDRFEGILNLIVHEGIPETAIPKLSQYAPDSPNVGIISQGKPVYANLQDFPPGVIPDELKNFEAIAVIPILNQGEVLGCLNVITKSQPGFSEYRKNALESIVSLMGGVISRLWGEKALKESEENFRTVFEQAGVGVVLEEIKTGIFERVNQEFCNILGYERAEIERRLTFRDLTFFEDVSLNQDEVNKLISGELKEFTAEKRFVHKDGYPIWVKRTITALGTAIPPTHFILVVEDISERKRVQEEIQQRIKELEAVSRISSALRTVQNLGEIYPLLMTELLEIYKTESGAIAMLENATGKFYFNTTHGWYDVIKDAELDVHSGILYQVLTTGKSYSCQDFSIDPNISQTFRSLVPPHWGGTVAPIRAGHEIIGALIISVELPRVITEWETRLLETIAEIVGNTVQRLQLFERTERNLRRLAVLHSIDTTISSSLDIQFTLRMLIEHVVTELEIDAGCIHLLNPATLYMEYSAGTGFHSAQVENIQIRPGNGLGGVALLERRKIHYSSTNSNGRLCDPLIDLEKFADGIAVPLVSKGRAVGSLEVYHHSLLNPDEEWSDYLEALAGQAALAIEDIRMYENLQQSNLELTRAYDATIEGWSRALDLRDKETEGHTQRVTEVTLRLARAMGIQGSDLNHIRLGSLLHDIGKMGIPDSILLKPGPLTDDEWVIMRMHPKYAYELLSSIAFLRPALDIPYCHHEKWDGSGYPRGLKGEQIPIAARIFSVIDVWDALRSDRPYRAAWDEQRVKEHIRSQSGSHFDPKVVSIFLSLLEDDQEYNHGEPV